MQKKKLYFEYILLSSFPPVLDKGVETACFSISLLGGRPFSSTERWWKERRASTLFLSRVIIHEVWNIFIQSQNIHISNGLFCLLIELSCCRVLSSVATGCILPSPASCCVHYLLRSGCHGSSTVHSLAASWPRGEALLPRRVFWVWLIHLWGAVLASLQCCNKFYFTFLGLLLNSQVSLKNRKQLAIPHSPLNVDGSALWIE